MNIGTNFNRTVTSPQFRANENVTKTTELDEKKGLSKGAKWAIGAGLTILGTYGIYYLTKGKSLKKKPGNIGDTNKTNINNLQIVDEKAKIGLFNIEDLKKYIDDDNLIKSFEEGFSWNPKEIFSEFEKVFIFIKANNIKKLYNTSTPEKLISEYDKIIATKKVDIPIDYFKKFDILSPQEVKDYSLNKERLDYFADKYGLKFTADMKLSQKLKQVFDKMLNPEKGNLDSFFSENIEKLRIAISSNDTHDIKFYYDWLRDDLGRYLKFL